MKNREAPWLGPAEWCTVIEHHPWGLHVKIDNCAIIAVIDLRFINDDIMHINQEYWPPIGTRLKVRLQGIWPNGQVRYTARAIDLALPTTRQEWLESPAGRAWLATQNDDSPST